MNRKTKIIICISAIIIIILGLIGFTYGYYLTRVTGNSNGNSIEVTTGTSSVLYTDLTEEIDIIIEPGTSTTKLFTVENTGNVRATYSIYLVDVINEFVRTEDVRYTIYRVGNTDTFPENYNGCTETTTDINSCKIVANDQEFPTTSTVVVANEVIETPGNYFKYALVTTYINQPTINQNVDQGHTYSAKVNIRGAEGDVNPYSEGTLAYNVVSNAISQKNGTKLGNPETTILESVSGNTERVLATSEDGVGTGTSYYFRGSVQDNYVEFKGMCFRIVRIEGDGAIKLIYAGSGKCSSTSTTSGNIGEATYGEDESIANTFGYYHLADYKGYVGNGLRNTLLTWLNNNFTSLEKTKYLKQDKWCLGGSEDYKYNYETGVLIPQGGEYMSNSYFYGYTVDEVEYANWYYTAGKRLEGIGVDKYATLKCSSEEDSDTNYVGTLTADEVAYAGASIGLSNKTYYLYEQLQNEGWLTLSLNHFYGGDDYGSDNVFLVGTYGNLSSSSVDDGNPDRFVRPSVTLVTGTSIKSGGEGTKTNPYVVE